jgi:cytochrome c-type biogenesis protein CcmF
VLGVRDRFALIGFGLCLFVLGTIVQEFTRGTLARHSATGENFAAAFGNLVRRNNRRYGGYVVHVGILLIGAGVVASQVYQQEAQASLAPGESMQLGGYTIVAHGIQTTSPPGVRVVDGVLTVNGEDLRPEKQFFDNFQNQPSTRVGLRSTPVEDLYVVLAGWDGEEGNARLSLAVFVNPLVSWIWTGGLLVLLGTVISL